MEEVRLQYSEVTFNGSFLGRTIYSQDPSPEVDDAWAKLGTTGKSAVLQLSRPIRDMSKTRVGAISSR